MSLSAVHQLPQSTWAGIRERSSGKLPRKPQVPSFQFLGCLSPCCLVSKHAWFHSLLRRQNKLRRYPTGPLRIGAGLAPANGSAADRAP
jgi:hypothetical protein